MAVGLASNEAAMFHLFTHAFFKALLFLAAGSVIVSLHHEQDIWKMGGLASKLKITFVTFAIGGLALIGCPPFSGFFSKDAILALAFQRNMPIFAIGLTTAFLTAFYVSRQAIIVFFGKPRSDSARNAHESPLVMIVPLLVLAFFALTAGLHIVAENFLVVPREKEISLIVPALAIMALVAGAAIAFLVQRLPPRLPSALDGLAKRHKLLTALYVVLALAVVVSTARLSRTRSPWIATIGPLTSNATSGAMSWSC